MLFVFSCSKDESNSEGVRHTLTIAKPKNGTVTSDPKGINCGSHGIACKAQVADGAKIKLIATADAGYELGAWGGACRGSDKKTCELTMNADKIANKIFNLPNEYTLTIDPRPINGTIISDTGDINCGDGNNDCDFSFKRGSEVILTASSAKGYELEDWGGDCKDTNTRANCTLTMDADKSVTKAFNPLGKKTLTITKPTHGKIINDAGSINCGSGVGETACSATFDHGTGVTLTATPEANYGLEAWGGDCSGLGATCTVAMTTNKTVAKTFTIAQRTLTIATRPANGTITSNPSGINCGESNTTCSTTFDHGTSVTLTAAPKVGYELGTWGGTDCSSETNAATCTLTMDADKTGITKAFTIIQRTLTIATKPANGTITSNPSGINCGESNATCEADFDHGTSVTLTAAPKADYVLGVWSGDDCAGLGVTCILTMNANKTVSKGFIATGGGVVDTDGDGVADTDDVDDDNDGLIEVHNLDMFNNIRHNLAGTSYKTSSSAAHNRDGAPSAETVNCTTATASVYLCGYELTTDLDFATAGSYEGSSVNDNWRPLDSSSHVIAAKDAVNAGFNGITDFASIFDGNGHSISHLYMRNTSRGNVGLFRSITADAAIRSLGVVDANLYIGIAGASTDGTGALVGVNSVGLILASYAKGGTVNDSGGRAGGLVGINGGSIIACYAAVDVNGSAGDDTTLGGLVGNNRIQILNVISGTSNIVDGSIIASYATGNVNTGDGNDDNVGGLVGVGDYITASYATGNVDGGAGSDTNIGALAGAGNGVFGGPMVIVVSYGFGSVMNGRANSDGAPGSKTVNGLTLSNAGSQWDDAASKTKGAWDFGTDSQPPALKYADYDGDMAGVDYCALFPEKIPGTNIDLECGTTLLPGQRP